MRNKIRLHFPDTYITTRSVANIYVADFSERTNHLRGVEVSNFHPDCPIDASKKMDCMIIHNAMLIDVDFNIFDDSQFKNADGRDMTHCECCIYPTINHDKSWVIMLEIKDCKPKNISKYKDVARGQIISTAKYFRDKNIITSHKVYGVLSFPRSKVSFDSTIFGMPPDYKRLKKEYNIAFLASNVVEIVDDTRIKPLDNELKG